MDFELISKDLFRSQDRFWFNYVHKGVIHAGIVFETRLNSHFVLLKMKRNLFRTPCLCTLYVLCPHCRFDILTQPSEPHILHYGIIKRLVALPIRIVKSNISSVGLYTLLSVSTVHQPFYISICISTLPTQDTTLISHLTLVGFLWNALECWQLAVV